MTLSEIRSALDAIGMRPTRSLGQNFLFDQNLARWVVEQLDLSPDDHLVEIGPGLGALTEYALPRCRTAQLIEKDGRLAGFLTRRFGTAAEVLHEDAVEFDARTLFPRRPLKVLGNLPYYVSSPILFRFAGEPSAADALVFTLQKELAQRLSASPSSPEYGALTLLIGRRWNVEYLRTLPAAVFFPEPAVESAVVKLIPRGPEELPPCDGAEFTRLVKLGFSQRRKQLRKLLQLPGWDDMAASLGVSREVRAEALDLDQWVSLVNLAAPAVAAAQDVHGEQFDVVDENDRVIRRASRHEVHTAGLRHRAVHIFIFNGRGELFLQKRSAWKDAHPSRWDSSAAGHVNAGQTFDATAPRELEEELGVETALQKVGRLPPSEDTGQEFVQLYEGNHEGPFRLPPSEIECGGFFPTGLIERWIAVRPDDFAGGFRRCFELWQERRSRL